MELVETKSILAKLMATENITVEQRKTQTASFDVKNRILTLPILDNNISPALYDLFTGHEVGHALWTPLDGLIKAKEDGVNMSIANVVEDFRIERLIRNKYPGLKSSFATGYKELINKNFFETNGKNINAFNFIDRLNLYCKGGSMMGIRFTTEERDLITQVEATETYDDVIEVSRLITKYMKMKRVEERKLHINENDGDDDTDDLYDFDYDSNDEPGEDENLDDEFNITEDKTDTDSEYKNYEVTEDDITDDEIRSITQESYHKNESSLFSQENKEIIYANIPVVNPDEVIFGYKDFYKAAREYYKSYYHNYDAAYKESFDSYLLLRNEANKVVSYLVKEFELRKNADQLKRASVSKTGELNMSKIYSYQFNDDIFKKITVVPGGKSHGLVLFLDWSGSMAEHILSTFKQLLSLVLFCKKANIPYEVYAFTTPRYLHSHRYKFKFANGDFNFSDLTLANILSSRMSASEFSNAAVTLTTMANSPSRCDFFRMNSTPLNEAIVAAMEIVPEFQKDRKLQVVNVVFLTDGDSDAVEPYVWDGNNRIKDHISFRQHDLVIRDTKTRFEKKISMPPNMMLSRFKHTKVLTAALLEMLSNRARCNVMGFFILSLRNIARRLEDVLSNDGSIVDENYINIVKNNFRKDRYYVMDKNPGFDEYYLLSPNGIDAEQNEFEVRENATTRGLVTAFSKYTGGRLNNRVVLNRFINLIS